MQTKENSRHPRFMLVAVTDEILGIPIHYHRNTFPRFSLTRAEPKNTEDSLFCCLWTLSCTYGKNTVSMIQNYLSVIYFLFGSGCCYCLRVSKEFSNYSLCLSLYAIFITFKILFIIFMFSEQGLRDPKCYQWNFVGRY